MLCCVLVIGGATGKVLALLTISACLQDEQAHLAALRFTNPAGSRGIPPNPTLR